MVEEAIAFQKFGGSRYFSLFFLLCLYCDSAVEIRPDSWELRERAGGGKRQIEVNLNPGLCISLSVCRSLTQDAY